MVGAVAPRFRTSRRRRHSRSSYFGLLIAAYRRRDLSVVYPVARGSAPVLVLIGSAVVLGTHVSAGEALGVCLVAAGVLFVRGFRHGAAGLPIALTIGCAIAAYTLVDKQGLHHASPIPYLELTMAPVAIALCAYVLRPPRHDAAARAGHRADGRRRSGLVRRVLPLPVRAPPRAPRPASQRCARRVSSSPPPSRRSSSTSASARRASPAQASSPAASRCSRSPSSRSKGRANAKRS